jgi:UDP-N-acetylmuramoyl-L-alanyl-D-glutamate--2,6-diaminopimelate ligase
MANTSIYKKYRHQRRVAINVWHASRAKRDYANPQYGMRLIGVTGTDGKTTTSTMLTSILLEAGRKVGLISTVGARINDEIIDTGLHVSTPGPNQIYKLLSQMKSEGVEDVVIEATSHGLDQRRLFGLSFAIGIITNLSPEHLDYHGTMEAYAQAKARLLTQSGLAILNADDPIVSKLNSAGKPQLLFGIDHPADIQAEHIQSDDKGSHFTLTTTQPHSESSLYIPLPGKFNISNALAASAAAIALQIPIKAIAAGLAKVSVEGRWQLMQTKPYTIIIDFAHTPQAFTAILPTARNLVKDGGRLIHVFGSAAQRDEEKRSQMGRISAEFADISVLTMEDPRHESLDRIQGMLASGLQAGGKKEGVNYWRIDDRQEAINWALAQAKTGDVVIITGKGHEQSLSIKGQEIPWSDVQAVKNGLRK